ncbi:MAG: alpha/beta fold hydrolase [Candidatus Thorarchaeota archaeon]|jgi:pimeloyl-ACP methyl ester carboxylesterase
MLVELSLVLIVVLFVWIIISYRGWKRNLLTTLNGNSEVATTSLGEIEYVLNGSGPVILFLHGAPGGYDQGTFDMEMWIEAGFSMLAISRPGYLRTPLNTGETFEEQADAIEGLLVTLGISKVAILAASGGGPIALHFALRHPNRLSALILMAAVSNEYSVSQEQLDSMLARMFLSNSGADFGAWLYDIITRRWTTMSLKMAFKETVLLESKERDDYVRQVMAIPKQVAWYKRFVRTTCPMSPRMIGFNNDLKLLQQVSFTNLEAIKCPTLVVHGTADGDVSFSNAEFAASSIPNAKLYSLENIGHMVWLGEHVSKMNSELIRFLGEHS